MRLCDTMKCFVFLLCMSPCLVLALHQDEASGGQLQFVGVESELFGSQWIKFRLANTGDETMVFYDPLGRVAFGAQAKDFSAEIPYQDGGARRVVNFILLRPGECFDYRVAEGALDFNHIDRGKTTLTLKYVPRDLAYLAEGGRVNLELVRGHERRSLGYESFPDFLWQLLYYKVVLEEDGTYWLVLRSKQTEISRWRIFSGSLTCSVEVSVRPKSLRFLGVLSELSDNSEDAK